MFGGCYVAMLNNFDRLGKRPKGVSHAQHQKSLRCMEGVVTHRAWKAFENGHEIMVGQNPQHELFHFWTVNHRIPWDPAQKWLFLAWWYRYESKLFIPQNERCSSKSGQIGGQKMVTQVFLQIARHLIWQYMHGVLVDSFRSPLRIPWAITITITITITIIIIIIIIIISFSYRSLTLLVAGEMMYWIVDDAGISDFSD